MSAITKSELVTDAMAVTAADERRRLIVVNPDGGKGRQAAA